MVAELLFGRSNVSETAWDRFLAAEVTPRFPEGLTVYDARGQWRNPETTKISRERSKVVMIAMPPADDNQTRLSAIIEDTNGNRSFWALAHPPGEPDFHDAACFAAQVPPAG